MVAIKNRFLVSKVNNQVTEPLVEKVNSISQLSLPVMITQALLRASGEAGASPSSAATAATTTNKPGFSIHDAMQRDDDEDEQQEMEQVIEEDEDEYLRTPDYVDVSEQGTINNASRMNRVLLKDKKKHRLAGKSASIMTSADISYLFDTNIPSSQREILLMKFELPVDTRNHLIGALTALNILLENGQVIRNMVFQDRYPNGAMVDQMMMDMDDETFSPSGRSKTATTTTTSTTTTLPEHMRQLVQHLVQLSAHPALEEWASMHYRKYPLNRITEAKASSMYNDVIDWICSCADMPLDTYYQHDMYEQDIDSSSNSSSSSDSHDNSQSSDEEQLGFVTIHKQKPRKQRHTMMHQQQFRYRHRRRRGHHHHGNQYRSLYHSDDDSSGSSNSAMTDDGDSEVEQNDRRMLSAGTHATAARVYPQRRTRRIESAAERMGETRRKGEHPDLDNLLSISYASEYYVGFSNRALVLLNSLARHGK